MSQDSFVGYIPGIGIKFSNLGRSEGQKVRSIPSHEIPVGVPSEPSEAGAAPAPLTASNTTETLRPTEVTPQTRGQQEVN